MRALAINNLHAPDVIGGYEMVVSECLDVLASDFGWEISRHCATSGRESALAHPGHVTPDLTGYFPRGWSHHHALLQASRNLRERMKSNAAKLVTEARENDITLLFNPRRLATPEWLPALRAARDNLVWVSDYWPVEYPDCDKLLLAANEKKVSCSPFVMYGAARVRAAYEGFCPTKSDLSAIRKAAFVSEFVMRKNLPAFPMLEEARVIRNGIDHRLFPFAASSKEREKHWGFCGRIQRDKGVIESLTLFEAAASADPSIRFLLAGDMSTGHADEVRRKIRSSPTLRTRVMILGKLPREQLATEFYHRIGVLLFPSLWDEPFALTVIEAMACGVLVMATDTGGTPEIVNASTGFSFSKNNPDDAAALAKHVACTGTAERDAIRARAREAAQGVTIERMAGEIAAFATA